ncbi:RNA polymerase subunit sigma-70 [Dactylosporangium sp. AC04546]|uniref:RNA polymerase subunit sigma-70 n=1 Tax=Dactylosporangium sp. AC04546 TaxID=2862460 RepID=UPI001EDCCC03|nr:RNA polymerase subunit sigma-70 [Dactylosporangium sp. AC04546]WVK86002.1 RNA polymerase subunit sigma-70 [Dactylosporangium sp. AC04546]
MNASLVARARAGDGAAFGALVERYRRELYVHCYRMLGSVQDAEDVLQETLTAAWRGLDGFAGRSSVRTWLYRIATNRCLNAARDASRRPVTVFPPDVTPPEPTRLAEPLWLQPVPDALVETREAVSLAFITAVQLMPAKQRAVLVLRDVLGFRAAEVADLLDTTEDAVNAALKRARSVLPAPPAAGPGTPREQAAAGRFAEAIERGDVDAVVALLTDDAWLTMPPAPHQYQGRMAIADFLRRVGFRNGRRYRLLPVGANGQPAFGAYIQEGDDPAWHAHGLIVVTVTGDEVSAFTRFMDNAVLPWFDLPSRIDGEPLGRH